MGNRVVSQRLMEIGERIRKRRQTLRWSQEKLAARKAGIPIYGTKGTLEAIKNSDSGCRSSSWHTES